MREIKFRRWDGKKMIDWNFIKHVFDCAFLNNAIVMQYTGLKDKNEPCKEVYEGDIIDEQGKVIGNQYENSDLLTGKTNFLIQGFGTKTWCSTYQQAVERGCKYAE